MTAEHTSDRPLPRTADVLVVGGGPAGLTTALALRTRAPNARIVVLEKAHYPREKFCAGGVGGRADAILAELGVRLDVPEAPVRGVAYTNADGHVAVDTGTRIGRVVRRKEYDDALMRAAVERGVTVVDDCRVADVAVTGDGVRVETSRGATEARYLVGADGVGSVVRRWLGLPKGVLRAQALEVDTEMVEGDPPRHLLHFDTSDRSYAGYFWDFPTVVDGRPMMCRGIYRLVVDPHPVDVQGLLRGYLARRGLDLDRYRNKRFAERGYAPAEHIARGRVMLAGEAAGIDPLTGEGIAQAIEYGRDAGRFLADALERDEPALDGWTRGARTSRLGRDLRIRVRGARIFYGRARPSIERFFLRTPEFIHVGCEHWARHPYSKGRLLRSTVRGLLSYGGYRWAGTGQPAAATE